MNDLRCGPINWTELNDKRKAEPEKILNYFHCKFCKCISALYPPDIYILYTGFRGWYFILLLIDWEGVDTQNKPLLKKSFIVSISKRGVEMKHKGRSWLFTTKTLVAGRNNKKVVWLVILTNKTWKIQDKNQALRTIPSQTSSLAVAYFQTQHTSLLHHHPPTL